jgi:MYXO-CTERM domain-containing protein
MRHPGTGGAARALSFLLVVAAPSVASAQLAGTQPGELANGGQFVDADTCANCHGNGYMGDTTFLPHDTWVGTMMGNAARDPVFKAALAIATEHSPGETAEHCVRCHSPTAFVRGHVSPTDLSALDVIDLQGVGCETCHRATQTAGPEGPYLLGDAQLVYDDDTGKRGKYADAVSPAHETVYDLGVNDARFCAQCHVVNNPGKNLIDATGADTGAVFPLETTFQEWESSDYAVPGGADERTCQQCHMRVKEGQWPLSKLPGGTLRTDPREHAFVGGNHWGIQAVMAANPERARQYGDAYELVKSRTLENLESAVSVTLVDAPTEATPGTTIDVRVRVENLSGHKFPTGYVDGRRAWIAIALVDSDGAERFLLGGYDAATGEIAAEPPTHVYRAQHGRWDGAAAVPELSLSLQNMLLSDTRIPPKGFTASPITEPSGEIEFGDGEGNWRSSDEATFTVTVPADVYGAQTLSARVYYQSITREYVEFLAAANTTTDHGTELLDIYENQTDGAPPIPCGAPGGADAAIDLGPGPDPTGTGGSGGQGGAGGGATSSAAEGGSSPNGDETDDDGCGCRTVGTREAATSVVTLAAAGLLLLGAAARRRRRRR